jgi:predicted nuclease of predicted toxin-antitoxin system
VRLFLDQMLRAELAVELQARGHDVTRAGDCGLTRADDEKILAHAISQAMVLVTLDGHFGDWAVLRLPRMGVSSASRFIPQRVKMFCVS